MNSVPYLGLFIDNNSLELVVFEKSTHANVVLSHLFLFNAGEIVGATIFNTNLVAQRLSLFIKAIGFDHAPIALVFKGNPIFEDISYGSCPEIESDDIEYYSFELVNDVWYTLGIPYGIRFQYQMLALVAQLNITVITSFIALMLKSMDVCKREQFIQSTKIGNWRENMLKEGKRLNYQVHYAEVLSSLMVQN